MIRQYYPDAFITHNGYFNNLDYQKLTRECLDFLSYDSYPAFQEKKGKGLGRNQAYKLSRTRGCSDPFMIMEQQAGPGGQLSYQLPTPLPGQIRLWTYQSIGHGATGVIYFRYRTALFGAEQLWYGIFDHDEEENERSREIRQVAEELSRLGDLFLQERLHNQVGIYQDYHNQCADQAESFAGNDQWEIFMALNRRNLQADFVYDPSEFEKYKVMILPHITVADETLVRAVEDYAKKGGVVILSARSGVKDRNVQYYPVTPPCGFRKLAGCRVDWFTMPGDQEKQQIRCMNKTYRVDGYYERLGLENGECFASYTEGYCQGKPAIVKNGNVYYVGFYCRQDAHLYADLAAQYVKTRDPIDQDVEQLALGSHLLLLNHSDREIPYACYDHITQSELNALPPYGVALVKPE